MKTEIPCWLLRSVREWLMDVTLSKQTNMILVLQGYLYLTNAHLCFFAHIPAREV